MADITGQITFSPEEIAAFPQGPQGPPGPSGSGGDCVTPQEFGAVADGLTDDTASFQACVDAAIQRKLPMLVPPVGTYRLDGTVTIQAHFFRWVMPFAGFQSPSNNPGDKSVPKILCMNANGPALKFVGWPNAVMKGLRIQGLKMWAGVPRFGQPLVQFGDASGIDDFEISDVWLDCRAPDGIVTDGMSIHTALVGSFRNCHVVNLAGGVGFRHRNNSTINTGNLGFYDCKVNFHNPNVLGGGVGWMFKEYFPGSGSLVNSIFMSNCKMVGATDSPNRHFNTFADLSVVGAHAVGVSTVTVADASLVRPGQWLTFSSVTNSRVWGDMVASVAGNVITLRSGLLGGPLANADRVLLGNWHTVAGNIEAVEQHVSHWENTSGVLASAVHNLQITEPLLGNYVPRGVYASRSSTRVAVHGGRGAGGVVVPADAVYFQQTNDSGNARNSVTDVNLADLNGWAGRTLIRNDRPSSPIGYRDTSTWVAV